MPNSALSYFLKKRSVVRAYSPTKYKKNPEIKVKLKCLGLGNKKKWSQKICLTYFENLDPRLIVLAELALVMNEK